jgi:citrate lyase beta subunit
MVLPDGLYERLDAALAVADQQTAAAYPGDDGTRQPVHTVYVPADRFTPSLPGDWGAQALAALDEPGLDLDPDVEARVRRKLGSEPIEDLRVDFEDGYGSRPDDEEDADAGRVAGALAAVTPFCGIRIKNLERATRRRGVRTLDLVLGGGLPAGFVVTLPKVTHVDQVSAFVEVCAALEDAHALEAGAVRFEIQIETPQSVLAVSELIRLAAGRVTGLHYGTYDYSAACGIAAPYQSLAHPAADHAKAVMQVAAAGTGVRLSDGSSNVLPVGTAAQVRAAWDLHAQLVRRALERGFYQGWDLHPLQLVTRYAATYGFYRDGMPDACARLRAYLERAAGGVLDEPATAQAMAALLVRGLHCGALDEDEVTERSGVDREALLALYRRRVGQDG